MIKKILTLVGTLAVLFVLAVGIVAYGLLSNQSDILDGELLADGQIEVIQDGIVSAFLIQGESGRFVLVDAGDDDEGTAIAAALARRGATTDDVEAIFLTHGHGDHIDGRNRFPDATLYGLETGREYVAGRRAYRGLLPGLLGRGLTGVEIDEGLTDGEVVRVAGVEVEVFAIPGHTAGSAAYLIKGVLFLGDSATAEEDGELRGALWPVSDDRPRNRSSLVALAGRLAPRADEVETLALSHQGSLRSFRPLTEFVARR